MRGLRAGVKPFGSLEWGVCRMGQCHVTHHSIVGLRNRWGAHAPILRRRPSCAGAHPAQARA